jgi:hypothetical protein
MGRFLDDRNVFQVITEFVAVGAKSLVEENELLDLLEPPGGNGQGLVTIRKAQRARGQKFFFSRGKQIPAVFEDSDSAGDPLVDERVGIPEEHSSSC